MPRTPNHNYNVPNHGDPDWHVPLNDNFEQFDRDIEVRDEDANRGNYDPRAGAKFFAIDTGEVYVGDGNNWNRLDTSGPDPTFEMVDAEHVGVGTNASTSNRIRAETSSGQGSTVRATTSSGDNTATAVHAEADSSTGNTFGVYTVNRSPEGHALFGVNFASSGNAVGVEGSAVSPSGVGVLGVNSSGIAVRSDGDCRVNGDLDVTGSKNFTQTVATDDGDREVVYAATEAPTPRTAVSGVAELDDGRAEVALPEHFAWVTSDEADLVVETTPYSGDSGGLAVVERSPERLVVADLDGDGDYEFSYTVRGTREGFADHRVVREPSAGRPSEAEVGSGDDGDPSPSAPADD